MKIGYVIPYLQKPTGWRSHTVAFVNAICQYVEPVLFVSAADYGIAKSLFPGRLIHLLPVTQGASMGSWRGRRDLAGCYLAIRRGRYPRVDLIHSLEAYPTGLVGSWLAGKLSCPHALTSHGTYGVVWYEEPLDRRLYEQVLKNTALICPVSYGTARLMQSYFSLAMSGARLQPILNGNTYAQSVPRAEAFGHAFPEVPTLLSVGDIKPRKGQHISLAAFAKVKEQLPQARYWIVGHYNPENAYVQELQQFIRERGLKDVTFKGLVSDEELRACYRSASVFVLTPQQVGLHFEGFGLVYLEAGAYGLPVVATRSGGTPDAVKDGETGLLAAQNDVAGVAEAILQLLSDTELARRLGRANRTWAEELTWERYAGEQYQLYQDLFAAGPPPAPGAPAAA